MSSLRKGSFSKECSESIDKNESVDLPYMFIVFFQICHLSLRCHFSEITMGKFAFSAGNTILVEGKSSMFFCIFLFFLPFSSTHGIEERISILRKNGLLKNVCQKSDEINSPSELVQVRVLRKAPYVKVGSPVRREELNSNQNSIRKSALNT